MVFEAAGVAEGEVQTSFELDVTILNEQGNAFNGLHTIGRRGCLLARHRNNATLMNGFEQICEDILTMRGVSQTLQARAQKFMDTKLRRGGCFRKCSEQIINFNSTANGALFEKGQALWTLLPKECIWERHELARVLRSAGIPHPPFETGRVQSFGAQLKS